MASDSAHTINVGNGKSLQGNLPSAVDVEGPSTAVRNARRVLGYSTDIGVLQQLSSKLHQLESDRG